MSTAMETLGAAHCFATAGELMMESGQSVPWIVPGLVAEGGYTDVHGRAKFAGKTTFTLAMVKAVLDGGRFLGERVQQSPVLYLTEQGNNIVKAFNDVGITGADTDLVLMPRGKTYGMSWELIVETAVDKALDVGARMMAVDTFPAWADLSGDQENDSGHVKRAIAPLLRACREHDIAVWSIRHSNRQGEGRGSSMYEYDADILLSIKQLDNSFPENVRNVSGVGRYDDIIDTNVAFKDGTFEDIGTEKFVQRKKAQDAIRAVLSEGGELEQDALIDDVAERANVSPTTARRALENMLPSDTEPREVERVGKGVKGNPYKYRARLLVAA